MNSNSFKSTWARLALVVAFCLPPLACSLASSVLPDLVSGDQETQLAADVNATLTANAETELSNVETEAVEATSTPPPSPTMPLPSTPTDTPEPTIQPTPTPTSTPAGPWVGEITFASDISQDDQPINPGTVFKRGVTLVYAFFPFSGIEKGKKITYYWTVNGKEFVSVIRTWEWDSSGTHPTSVGYSDNSQLDTGNWMLTIFVGNQKMASGTFRITP